MNYQAFPPALLTLSPRLTRVGDPGASVAGVNTTTFADGALVYCLENKQTYRLDRQDDTTPADGTTVIAPSAGPGRWKLLPGGGTLAPLHQYYFVDPLTTVPVADQNGSVAAPFSTVQAGVDAIGPAGPDGGIGTLVVTGSAFGAVDVPLGVWLTILGCDQGIGPVTLHNFSRLDVQDAFCDVSTADPADVAEVNMTLGHFSGFVDAPYVLLVDAPSSRVMLNGYGVAGPVNAATLSLLNCTLSQGTTLAATDLNAVNSYFTGTIPATFAAGRQVFKSCEFEAAMTVTNASSLQMDTYSDARFTASGSTTTGGVTVVG